MPIRSFLDLEVYQKSYQAALVVNREVVPKLPDSEKCDLKDQSRRASKAIPAIIAEGYARKHHKKDWQKYIDDAIGEANEMIVHLSLAKDLYPKHINVALCEELIKTYDIIGKQLFRLGQSWNKNVSLSPPPHPASSLTSHFPILLTVNLALEIPQFGKIQPPTGIPTGGISKLSEIISVALTLLFIFVVILALFVIIYSGIQWIISGGDKQKVEQARGRLTFAIVGLLVAFFSFFIINLIGNLFGVTLIQP